MDVGDWLRGLWLGQYEAVFRQSDIDGEVLPELTDQHLKDLGVSLGRRLKILRAIRALVGTAPSLEQPTVKPEPKAHDTAERRQLTVMFCDLVGSTAMSARLDPEDMRGIIAAYHKCCASLIEQNGGFVAKYMGDGVLAYFGYPQAHEHDAERAVRAGLAIVEVAPNLETAAGAPLHVRVGIATGIVVVGDLLGSGESQERGVVGDTPNLAARLQGIAEPDSVVVGEGTYKLTGGLFEYEDLDAVEVKGFADPVQASRVLRASGVASRFEAFHSTVPLTPLVGRDEEVELLLRRWQRAKSGEGQVTLLSGEPGIGKSRLTRAIQDRFSDEPHVRLLYFCSPHHQASALFPFISQLERAAGFERDEAVEHKLDKLEALLARLTNAVAHDAAVLAEPLSVPSGGRYPPLDLQPQKRKETTLATLLAQLEGLAARQPVLMIFEDAHWIDPTSLELLELTVERAPSLAVLLVITFRAEFRTPWVGRPHVTMHPLNRLGRREALAMVEKVARGKALPKQVVDQIVARADGVPLFVEELTKAVLESELLRSEGDRYVLRTPQLAIPTSLHASLMARLDSLSPVREIAEVGAAIGREFSYGLIRAVAPRPEPELEEALDQLVASELVFRRGTPPDAIYTFKHALVQDTAYSTLLRGARQQLHGRIAAVLEERFPETADTQPELLAHHLTEAGLAGQAIPYWRRAGERARERGANVEAVAHLSKGLTLVAALPGGRQRAEVEFALQTAIGGPLIAVKGYSSAEVEQTYLRARELCEQLGRSSELFPVLRGLWNCYLARGEHQRARSLAEQLAALAEEEQEGDALRRALACRALGASLFFLGRLHDACSQFKQGAAFDDAAAVGGDRSPELSLYADSPGVACRLYLACTEWLLGMPDAALGNLETGLALSDRSADPHIVTRALAYAALVHHWRGDFDTARLRAEAAIALAREHGIPQWLHMATICRGVALARLGEPEAGIGELRAGSAGWHAIGSRGLGSLWLGFTAEACTATGQIDAALDALDRAADEAAAMSELFYQAELHRLRGTLPMTKGDSAGAEDWLRQAIEVAVSQGAKSLELRAATSLARLWRDQGRRVEAHDLLAPVYGWFTEGFDTLDLKEAKALMEELA